MYKNHGSKGLEEGWLGGEEEEKEGGVESMLLARSDEMNRKERKTQRGITKDAGSVALNLPSLNSPPPSSSIFPGALLVISLSLSSSLLSFRLSLLLLLFKLRNVESVRNARQFRARSSSDKFKGDPFY